MGWSTCLTSSRYNNGLTKPSLVPSASFKIAIKLAQSGADALVPLFETSVPPRMPRYPPWKFAFAATSGTPRPGKPAFSTTLLLSCHDGVSNKWLQPPPLARVRLPTDSDQTFSDC